MMADVVDIRARALRRAQAEEVTGSIGMVVALAAWGMMFASLMFVYFGLRSKAPQWPPLGIPALPLGLPIANTMVIAASSATLVRALAYLRAGARGDALRWMGATLALGILFVVLQFALWRMMWLDGVTVSTGVFGTVFYGLTVLHAVHVAAGIAVLGYLLVAAMRARSPISDGQQVVKLRMCGMFWHFVGAVWIFMFAALFVM